MSGLLEYLRKNREDRAMMADLRCVLVATKRHRAWPILAKFSAIDNKVSESIAGYYATHPLETNSGNLGDTCRQIGGVGSGAWSGEHSPSLEKRFQYLLAADRSEICDRISQVIRMAKSSAVPIHYEQLERDLRDWRKQTRVKWAQSFWSAEA